MSLFLGFQRFKFTIYLEKINTLKHKFALQAYINKYN